ncbi:hypothetical protein P4238_28535 [Pseudomonas aeruginosa]|nr:hypothetical protein [Pseudomonas aeruginosa]
MSSELSANLVALNTIVYREVRRFTRIWPQTCCRRRSPWSCTS